MIIVGVCCLSVLFASTVLAAERPVKIKVWWDGLTNLTGPNGWPDAKYEDYLDTSEDFTARWFWISSWTIYLMELANPEVKVEIIERPSGSQEVQIAGGTAPCFTWGDPVVWAAKGLGNDITELVKKTDLWKKLPGGIWQAGTYQGRIYGLPRVEAGGFFNVWGYRYDWFKEAGLFDENGVPGPPQNWTIDDFTAIAQKLRDPKKNRWAFTLYDKSGGACLTTWMNDIFGVPVIKPDPTGKYTWRAAFNTPESAKVLQWMKDMKWKYDAVLAGFTQDRSKNFCILERTAMFDMTFPYMMNRFYGGKSNIKSPEGYGMRPEPLGPGGYRDTTWSVTWDMVNPTLHGKEKEAAFQWLMFLWHTPGAGWDLLRNSKLVEGKWIPGYCGLRLLGRDTSVYDKILPKRMQKVADSVILAKSPPQMYTYGLTQKEERRLNDELKAAIEAVLANKDADPQEELNKVAKIVDTAVLNYKLEGVGKENFKGFYTARAQFYKKNYPEYYEKVYKQLFEKYFKVW